MPNNLHDLPNINSKDLLAFRNYLGWTQEEMAYYYEISPSTLKRWEKADVVSARVGESLRKSVLAYVEEIKSSTNKNFS